MSLRLAAGATVTALLVAVIAGAAGALSGDAPVQVGWWSRDPSATAEPEGGFQVAAVAGQPASVAALRFSTPSGVTSATLTLQESGGFVTPASALQVCVTSDPWEAANPGAMEDAPAPDCTLAAPLERDADATTWTAEVVGLLPTVGGSPSLMIVPDDEAAGGSPLDPGLRVSFAEAALEVVAAPGTTTSTTVAPNPSFGGGPSPSTGGGPAPTFTSPGPVSPTTTVPQTGATVPPEEPTGESFDPPDFAAGASPGGGGPDQPWERLLFLVPLSALAGIVSVYGRRFLAQRGVVEV